MKIIELAGIGPSPMAAMLLADMGATVIRIDRPQPAALGIQRPLKYNLLLRNRRVVALDLKKADAVETVLRMVERADALIEGFRPGVTERMGLGPDDCLRRNPALVYGRMTGWGQTGPLAQSAGHDLNYIALTGALDRIGRAGQPPSVPLNIVGDYGGGGLYLALGLLAGILNARKTGTGQVVDAAIVDGTASLMTSFFGMQAAGMLKTERGTGVMDSGAYFYDVYQCADGRWVSVAPIEGKFHAELLRLLGVDPASLGEQMDEAGWPEARVVLAATFKNKTQAQWCELLEGSDACFAPVLTLEEAAKHPHLQARASLIEVDGVVQPAPAPRFSRTVSPPPIPPQEVTKENTQTALADWFSKDEIQALRAAGTIE